METKHTKGKWYVSEGNVLCAVKSNYGKQICICHGENRQSNAKLIAAAPLLLEALLNIENDAGDIPQTIWDMRNRAIEKATK